MNERSYLIALSPFVDPVAVKDRLKQDKSFSHWWNHLPGVFLVTSRLTADEITDRLRPVTEDARFLVARVELDDTEGWLPEKGWKWIKDRESETNVPAATTERHSTERS